MKQILFSLMILVCLSPVQGQTVSKSAALQVAGNYFQSKTGKSAINMRTAETPASRGGNPMYYVCTPDDGKGFVIVAGTKASIPILAYSPNGSFPTENMPEVVKYWMSGYEKQLEEIVEKRLSPTPQISAIWDALEKETFSNAESSNTAGPLLQTTWNQSGYYNDFCPDSNGVHAPTGCVATAMAQIMKYWNFPVSGAYAVMDIDIDWSDGISGVFTGWVGGDYYDWEEMPDALGASSTQNQKDQVGLLMYHCGIAAQMNYGVRSSGSNIEDAQNALATKFGYTSCSILMRSEAVSSWSEIIKDEIDAGRPVYYRGVDEKNEADPTDDAGHAWVCDGYKDGLFRMNWGWGWTSIDYYSLDNLNPGNTYNTDQEVILGIQPPGCIANYEGSLPEIPGISVSSVEANDYIHITSGTVESGDVCILNAGTEIVLEAGFTVLEGATAHFYIEGCNNELASPSEERAQQEAPPTVPATITTTDFTIAPNPFYGSTNFQYSLLNKQSVSIEVFNATGVLVATPLPRQSQDAGAYRYTFEANNLPAGIYLVVLEKDGERISKRIILAE